MSQFDEQILRDDLREAEVDVREKQALLEALRAGVDSLSVGTFDAPPLSAAVRYAQMNFVLAVHRYVEANEALDAFASVPEKVA